MDKNTNYVAFAIVAVVAIAIGCAVGAYAFPKDAGLYTDAQYTELETAQNLSLADNVALVAENEKLVTQIEELTGKNDYYNDEFDDEITNYAGYDALIAWANAEYKDELENELANMLGLADEDDLNKFDFDLSFEGKDFVDYFTDDEDIVINVEGGIKYESEELGMQGEFDLALFGIFEDGKSLDDQEIHVVAF